MLYLTWNCIGMKPYPLLFFLIISISSCRFSNISKDQRHAIKNFDSEESFSFSSGLAKKVQGNLVVLVTDYTPESQKKSKTEYWIEEENTERIFRLNFTGQPPHDLRTGDTVRARGKLRDNFLHVSNRKRERNFNSHESDDAGIEDSQAEIEVIARKRQDRKNSNSLRAVVILGNFSNDNVECTKKQMKDIMFDGPDSISKYFKEFSGNRMTFTGSVVGPYNIAESTTAQNHCSSSARDKMLAKARGDIVNIAKVDYFVYVMPKSCKPGVAGEAPIGGKWSSNFLCHVPDVIAHELGHNIGMHHADKRKTDGKIQEYGDTSDIMGFPAGLRGFNSIHKEQMNWIKSANLETVSTGTYEISHFSQNNSKQVLKIPIPKSQQFYYVSYRQAVGYFDQKNLKETYIGVNIHRGSKAYASKSTLVKVLQIGDTFSDSKNDIYITHLNSSFETAEVQIQPKAPNGGGNGGNGGNGSNGGNDSSSCIEKNPSITATASEQSTEAGASLKYELSMTNNNIKGCGRTKFEIKLTSNSNLISFNYNRHILIRPNNTLTRQISVSSASSISAGNYDITAQFINTDDNSYSATTNLTYSVRAPACIPKKPSISLKEDTLSGPPGESLKYHLTVKNNDASNCESTSFNLSGTVPDNWRRRLDNRNLTIKPQETQETWITITSSKLEDSGNFQFSVKAEDSADSNRSNNVTGVYKVESAQQGDTEAPTAPSNLQAAKKGNKIKLTWSASTDNTKVSGYNIWRNKEMIAQIKGTNYKDSSFKIGKKYKYTVEAHDPSGNVSPSSNNVTFKFE